MLFESAGRSVNYWLCTCASNSMVFLAINGLEMKISLDSDAKSATEKGTVLHRLGGEL